MAALNREANRPSGGCGMNGECSCTCFSPGARVGVLPWRREMLGWNRGGGGGCNWTSVFFQSCLFPPYAEGLIRAKEGKEEKITLSQSIC